jgi:branched-chain amino acid transport system substrate-binding protein
MRALVLAIALGFTFLAVCSAQPHVAQPPGPPAPVKIGLVVPLGGEAGRVGLQMQRAAQMAVADQTETLDRKVELVAADDQFDPRQAVVVAGKLVQDEVWGVVGHFYSSTSIPASGVYHEAGIPMITPTSTSPRLTEQGYDNVFRACGRDDQQAVTAADFILTRLRARRIAVVHDRTDYGRGLAEALARTVERRGGRRVVFTAQIAQGDKDFSALVARLTAAGPEVVYFGGIFREAGYLLRQMRQAGLMATFVSGDATLDPEFVRIAGEEAATGSYLTFARDPTRIESAQPVIRQFQERYGPLGPYVLPTYDAMGALLHAIKLAKAKSSSPTKLRKIIRMLHTAAYAGALGRLRWDKNGDLVTSPYVIYAIKKGGSLQGWFEQGTGLASGTNGTREAQR